MPSAQEQTSDITPSLVALDDAQALMKKVWSRGDPGEDIPRQYSTTCGHLTPTQPRYKDMRMDSTLNVTPGGSLNDIPTASRGNVGCLAEAQQMLEAPEQEIVSNCPSATMSDGAVENPYTSVKVLSERTPDEQMSRLTDMPRRVQPLREASQEDALASTRHFFAHGNGQGQARSIGSPEEVPITTIGGVTIETYTHTTTSTVLTTSTTTTAADVGMGSPSHFLPNGSPSRLL